MNRPKVLQSTQLLDAFFSVRKDQLLYPNDCVADYYVLSTTKESVCIIATRNEEIIVMHEYRHPVQKVLLGLPGGLVDNGENFLEAAKRELLEETGCTADSFELLGWTYPLPGVLSQKMAVVWAKNVSSIQECQHQDMEIIDWKFIPLAQLKKQIISGQDVDAILCSALLYFFLTESLL